MMNSTALSLETQLEHCSLRFNAIHKTWGLVTLRTNEPHTASRPPADFVIAIDVSASMRDDAKLAFVQATIEYLLSVLDENQTFSLVTFNHEVRVLATLLKCVAENKAHVMNLVNGLQATGSTNIGGALEASSQILTSRGSTAESRISTVMLFTDGLSTRGLSTAETLRSLDTIRLPPGCVFNTFGFGPDQDSQLLHAIALKAQGVYYYIETREAIPSTFGECVAGILSTRAHQIEVQLCAQDGARLVTLATPFRITEQQVAKVYGVNVELLYAGESKAILFRLSLRALPRPVSDHSLLVVNVSYVNTITQQVERLSERVKISRPSFEFMETSIPESIDEHLNRYAAATTITEAIELSRNFEFNKAQEKLYCLIERVQSSSSGKTKYCQDLALDLGDCANGMTDVASFRRGIHFAHACSSMYFMERSTGLRSLFRDGVVAMRHLGNAYTTPEQQMEAQRALSYTLRSAYVTTGRQ